MTSLLTKSLVRLAAAAVLASGCAAGSKYAGGVFENGRTSYRFPEPSGGWQRIELGDVAFLHPETGAVIYASSMCDYKTDVPLASLSDHLLLDLTERSIAERKLTRLDGREALCTTATGKLDGVPVVLRACVLKKNWCVYDLVHTGFPGSEERTLPAFNALLGGFGTLK